MRETKDAEKTTLSKAGKENKKQKKKRLDSTEE
jgi:hypothetical protein